MRIDRFTYSALVLSISLLVGLQGLIGATPANAVEFRPDTDGDEVTGW